MKPISDAGAIDLSIIICTRNRAACLAATLATASLVRSQHAWEILVIDNASSDNTAEIVRAADDCGGRLSTYRVEQIGLGAARDAGWRRARGRIVAFTDDDCYLDPEFVDVLVKSFDENPDVGCIGGRILLFDPKDAHVTIDERDEPEELPTYSFVDAGVVHGANLAFRRLTLSAVGGFDPMLGAGTPFPCEDIAVAAAVLWSGERIRFEPRAVVWHHHRRRVADVDKLFMGYDRGRGAYFAKFLLRRDTRRAYALGWWTVARRRRGKGGLVRTTRELAAAREYLVRRRAFGFLCAAALPTLVGYAIIGLLIGLSLLRKRGLRLSAFRRASTSLIAALFRSS